MPVTCTCIHRINKFYSPVGPGFVEGSHYSYDYVPGRFPSYRVWHDNSMYYTVFSVSIFNEHFLKDEP